MRKKILAFGASNSSKSINRIFASYAAQSLVNVDIELLDLNDFEMPIYSIDRENNSGIPELAKLFREKIENCDAIIISFAEHNGSYSSAFKNIMDWVSRIEGSLWGSKKMLLLSTSPGGRGGMTVLDTAFSRFPYMGAEIVGKFSLPSFMSNFDSEIGIINEELRDSFLLELNKLKEVL